jgi:signal transduction histidine kinase
MADTGGLGARLRRLASGVRFRTTAVAVVVVGLVLVGAIVFLAAESDRRVEASVTASAEARAESLAVLAAAGLVTDPLAAGSRLQAQVVDAAGVVVAASPGIGQIGPFVGVHLAPDTTARYTVDSLFEELEGLVPDVEDEGPYVVVARGAAGPEGEVTVLVAASEEVIEGVGNVVAGVALIGLPIVLLAVAVLVWILTGWSMRPVDRMSRDAGAISATHLDHRLPVPEAGDELTRLAETLNDMLDRLEVSLVRQRRFVADASHEMKSPVASIRAMVDVARESPGFDEWDRLLADLSREDARLEHLVSALLVLARSDEQAAPGRAIPLDLDQMAGIAAHGIAAQTGVVVHTSGIRPVQVVGDPEAIDSLLRNLLENATQHAARAMWVEVGEESGQAIVRISDDGPGIPLADRERAFDRFVRLDEARSRDAGGAGLGLAVCRAVAAAHGGTVEFVDPAHGGTTAEVRLPLGRV